MLMNQVIQVASEPVRAMTHFAAPGNEFKIDGAMAKFFKKCSRLWIVQGGLVLACCGDQRLSDLVDVAAISHAYWKTKPHTGIAIMPVGYWRIYELRVRHNDGDIVVGHNHRTSRTDLPNYAKDTSYFDAIPNRDRPLRQDHQAADEITGDVLQAESDTDANRTSKNCQGGKVNAGVL